MPLVSYDEFSVSYRIMHVINTAGMTRQLLVESLPATVAKLFDAQGFAWGPRSVTFDTVSFDESASVEVFFAQEARVAENTYRALQVPFCVSPPGEVMICNTLPGDDRSFQVPPGDYALIYEMQFKDVSPEEIGFGDPFWDRPPRLRLTFIPDESAEAKILRQDKYLSPTYPLVFGYETFGEAFAKRRLNDSEQTASGIAQFVCEPTAHRERQS